MVGLRDVDVNKLKTGVDAFLGGFNAGGMVKVDEHLNPVFGLIIVHHTAQVAHADHFRLVFRDLDEDGRFFGGGGLSDGFERFLVVDVEGAESEFFGFGALIQGAGGFGVGGHDGPFL
jgi:hypothetical protein